MTRSRLSVRGRGARLFGDRLFGDVLHVGSTAVPGLPPKPVNDLQARSDDPADAVAGRADSPTGWEFVPCELDRRP